MKIFDVLTKIFLSPYRWEPGPGPGIGRVAEKFLITGVSAAGCWAVSGPGWSGDVYLCFDPMFVRLPGPGGHRGTRGHSAWHHGHIPTQFPAPAGSNLALVSSNSA